MVVSPLKENQQKEVGSVIYKFFKLMNVLQTAFPIRARLGSSLINARCLGVTLDFYLARLEAGSFEGLTP